MATGERARSAEGVVSSRLFSLRRVMPFLFLQGTVVERGVFRPTQNAFLLAAHAGCKGTTKATRYHVLHDEIGVAADELQALCFRLSFTACRAPRAVSVVAPLYYARLAAGAQKGVWRHAPRQGRRWRWTVLLCMCMCSAAIDCCDFLLHSVVSRSPRKDSGGCGAQRRQVRWRIRPFPPPAAGTCS